VSVRGGDDEREHLLEQAEALEDEVLDDEALEDEALDDETLEDEAAGGPEAVARARGRQAPVRKGCLYVVGTPIGNLEDLTLRAARVLREVDLIAAEDTRTTRVLLAHLGIATPMVSYYKDVEARRTPALLAELQAGKAVALVSDAGMPGVSDPGGRLLASCLEAGLEVDVIPGPSAALTALLLSGLPGERFTFVGFLPRGGAERGRLLEELAAEPGTLILFESPRRVGRTLADLLQALGERPAAVARELTKLHQEVARGTLSELAARYAESPPRGEVTLVIGGRPAAQELSPEALEAEVRGRLERGESARDIAHALAEHGRRRVYQLALQLRASLGG